MSHPEFPRPMTSIASQDSESVARMRLGYTEPLKQPASIASKAGDNAIRSDAGCASSKRDYRTIERSCQMS